MKNLELNRMESVTSSGELCFNNVACYGVETLMGIVFAPAGIAASAACLFASCDGDDAGSEAWYEF